MEHELKMIISTVMFLFLGEMVTFYRRKICRTHSYTLGVLLGINSAATPAILAKPTKHFSTGNGVGGIIDQGIDLHLYSRAT